jgi:signal peptidase I
MNPDQITTAARPRKPWLAALFSLFLPGLGQVYNGEAEKGIVLFSILFLAPAILYSICFPQIPRPFNIALPFLILFSFRIYIIIDAFVVARKLGKSFELKPYNSWHYYLLAVAVSWSLSEVVFKGAMLQSFKLASAGMAPTLQTGDYIFADKLAYGIRNPVTNKCIAFCDKPQRGDVVVFIFPEDRTKDFVKRVMGVGGDTVEIHDKEVYINGKQIDDPHAHFLGDDPQTAALPTRDDFGPRTVPENHIFVIGDNRDCSYDSRYWGFVSVNDVKGKIAVIYWSWNGGVRWERIGELVH